MAGEYLNLLGLAKKANLLELGEEACAAASRLGRVRVVLTASDAAEGTRFRSESFSLQAGIPHIPVSETKEELGNALGKRPCAVIGVCDAGMAAAIVKKLSGANADAAIVAEDMEKKADRILKRRNKKKKKRAR